MSRPTTSPMLQWASDTTSMNLGFLPCRMEMHHLPHRIVTMIKGDNTVWESTWDSTWLIGGSHLTSLFQLLL